MILKKQTTTKKSLPNASHLTAAFIPHFMAVVHGMPMKNTHGRDGLYALKTVTGN